MLCFYFIKASRGSSALNTINTFSEVIIDQFRHVITLFLTPNTRVSASPHKLIITWPEIRLYMYSFHLRCTLIAPFIPALSLCLANSPNTNTANTSSCAPLWQRGLSQQAVGLTLCWQRCCRCNPDDSHIQCCASWRVSTHRSSTHARLAGWCIVGTQERSVSSAESWIDA